MSSPRAIIQILITGTQILGKALAAGAKQAYKNAQHRPQGVEEAAAAGATGSASTDKITRETKMTLDEARLILNVKQDVEVDALKAHYEHLFKANSPPLPSEPSPSSSEPAAKPGKFTSSRASPLQNHHSHYLLSKVVRAKERLELEMKVELEKISGEENLKVSEEEGTTAREEIERETIRKEPPPPSTPPPS